MSIEPAPPETGIWFHRADEVTRDPLIAARWDRVADTRLGTTLQNDAGVRIGTVEHVLAALVGCGVQNARISVTGPEAPILDGSAAPFVGAIRSRGLRAQPVPLRVIEVLRPVEHRIGASVARLEPYAGSAIAVSVEFDEAAIGRQSREIDLAGNGFERDLADSRTFCSLGDVDAFRAGGRCLGGDFDNALVFDRGNVLSPGGLRHADEPVRHKMLDVLGDLALAGAPILGRYVGHRPGHRLTTGLLSALMADPDAFRMRPCTPDVLPLLPGQGGHGARIRAVA